MLQGQAFRAGRRCENEIGGFFLGKHSPKSPKKMEHGNNFIGLEIEREVRNHPANIVKDL
jgi:hypothetical protein